MKKIIGICDLHNEPQLGELTAHRPLGSVSFLGRYGLIDFTLSNFSNSSIDRVYILARSGAARLRKHLGNGAIWTNNTKRGFVGLYINERGLANPTFNTDLNNIKENLNINDIDFDYAVVAPAYFLASMDFRPIINAHAESEADITVVYTKVDNADQDYFRCDKLRFGEDNKVIKSTKNLGRSPNADISLDTYIISKKAFKKMISDVSKVSELYSIKDMVNYYIEEEELDIRGYRFDGYVVPILSLNKYVEHSLNLLNYHIRNKLMLPEWPIYTTTHNTPPALYGRNADVENSFIANGAIIKGKVKNCIISREVVVEKDADLKNCIIFTHSEIGRGVKMEYVVCDKEAKVSHVEKLIGKEDEVIFIDQGAKI